jgi:hypothetical protein
MASLTDMYRRLLVAYPSDYRSEHEEEILTTLLEAAEPGRRWPSLRETGGLLVGGLRTRAATAVRQGGRTVLGDGLRLGTALLLASLVNNWSGSGIFTLTRGAFPDLRTWVAPILLALALVAVIRGAVRAGLALVLLGGAATPALQYFSGALPASQLVRLLDPAMFGSWMYVKILFAAVLLFGLSSMRGARRPWPWWLAAVLVTVPMLWELAGDSGLLPSLPLSVFGTYLSVSLVVPYVALIAGALLARDPRASIAAGLYAAGPIVTTGYLLTGPSCCFAAPNLLRLPLLLVAVSVLTTVATMRVGGRRLVRR